MLMTMMMMITMKITMRRTYVYWMLFICQSLRKSKSIDYLCFVQCLYIQHLECLGCIRHSINISRLKASSSNLFEVSNNVLEGFPCASALKYHLQCRRCRRHGFDPWVRKILRRRVWQPTPAFWDFQPGKSQGQRSLAGHSPWGHKASVTWLKQLSTYVGILKLDKTSYMHLIIVLYVYKCFSLINTVTQLWS